MNFLGQLLLRFWKPLTLLQLAVITTLSLIPLPELPALPGNDKTHHLLAYGCLMLPVAFVRPPTWLYLGLSFIAWSGVIELIQPSVNRYGEWLDFAANATGVVLGAVLGFLLALSFRRLRKPPVE